MSEIEQSLKKINKLKNTVTSLLIKSSLSLKR